MKSVVIALGKRTYETGVTFKRLCHVQFISFTQTIIDNIVDCGLVSVGLQQEGARRSAARTRGQHGL